MFAAVLWPLLILMTCRSLVRGTQWSGEFELFERRERIPRNWLRECVFPAGAKFPFGVSKSLGPVEREALAEFVDRLGAKDEVWYFASPASSWAALSGRAGLVVKRRWRPIGIRYTRMN